MNHTFNYYFKAVAIALLFLLFINIQTGFAQQVIGSYPSIDGGFEAQANGTLVTANSIATGTTSAAWTKTITAGVTATITASGGRSGPKYFTWSCTNAAAQRANSPTTPDGSILNATSYVIQYFYKTTALPNNIGYGISPDGTGSSTTATNSLVNTAGVWTKVSVVILSGTSAMSPKYGLIQPLRTSANANGVPVDLDDIVLYQGPLDNTAPASPGAVSATPFVGGTNVSWGAAGSTDGGGYVVVRYSGAAPGAADDPNQNGIYTVNNTAGTGTVRYIGTGTSFSDAGLAAGTDYYYKVYTVDKAFNYSAEVVTATPAQSTPANFYYNGSGSLAALSSWGLNTNGTGTAPADFTSDAQTFEIRNTTAVSTDAPWTVSGTGSKIVLGNTAVPSAPITLTITTGNAITTNSTAFEVAQPVSGHHTIIYQNPTVLSLGTVNDPMLEAIYDGVTISTATAKTYGNLSLINNADVTFTNSPVVTTLTVPAGSVLTASSTANITIASGGSVVINGTFKTARQPGFVGIGAALSFNGVQNLSLGNASTIEYNRAGTLTQAINAMQYANLVISNVAPKQFEAGALKISGSFTVTPTTINAAVSSLEFNGTALQTIPAFAFNNITVNNAAGILLSGVTTVAGQLSLLSGQIQSSAINTLALDVNATVTGGSNTSFINGPVTKLTNSTGAFVFPVGKNSLIRTVTLTPSSTTAGSYTAEYVNAAQGNTSLNSPLIGINTNEYWDVTKNSGPDASLSLSYDNTINTSWSGTSPGATTAVTIAHFTGASWQDEGATVIPGTSTTGIVVSNVMSSFSPFTFAVRPSAVVAVTLTGLSVKAVNKFAQLTWTVHNESDISKYETERSSNGIDFVYAGKVTAQNLAVQNTYSWTDNVSLKPINYYRLKIIHSDGTYRYSNIVSLKSSAASAINISPDPVRDNTVITHERATANATVSILNSEGKTVKTIFVIAGTTQTKADCSVLAAGIYFVVFNNNGARVTTTMSKQ